MSSAARSHASLIVLAAVALPLVSGCKRSNGPQSAPSAERRLTSFLGVDLRRRYYKESCDVETGFANKYKYATETCVVDKSKDQSVFVLYVTDDRLPHLRGHLLSVYAVLHRTIFEDAAAMDGYLEAAAKKYGPLRAPNPEGRRYNLEKTLICGDKSTNCEEALIALDENARFNSVGLAFAAGLRGQDSGTYVEYSLTNVAVLEAVSTLAAETSRRRGAAAIE